MGEALRGSRSRFLTPVDMGLRQLSIPIEGYYKVL